MQLDGKLPASLHAWGNQSTDCPCGCSHENVIRQRGICAQLVQVPVVSGRCVYRHLHPYELALLNGMLPPAAWHEPDCQNLRLCLSAVGQLASPLQSAWFHVLCSSCSITLDFLNAIQLNFWETSRLRCLSTPGKCSPMSLLRFLLQDGFDLCTLMESLLRFRSMPQAPCFNGSKPS